MSRELKFRAWANGYEKWCEFIDYTVGVWLGTVKTMNRNYKTTDVTVEQYTGLPDCIGKDIYEGDIIEVETGTLEETEVSRYVVYWNENMFDDSLRLISGINYDDYIGDLSPSSVRVIGNIHENPELLGDKD